jgi:hypothetical protein
MAKYSETSTRCAVAILRAWRRHNLDLLDRKLAKAARGDSDLADTCESERWELLTGIAHEFRRILVSGKVQEAMVFVPLLENLARPGSAGQRALAASASAAYLN